MATWIGGTQSPLMRGYLRAAVIRMQEPEVNVLFDVHDVDAAGFEGGTTPLCVLSDDFPKKAWRPLTFEDLFSFTRKQRAIGGMGIPANATVAGLRAATLVDVLTEDLLRRAERIAQIALRVGVSQDAVHERAALLVERTQECAASPSATWSDLCIALILDMAGHALMDVSLGTTSEYWGMEAIAQNPERFTVLERFLTDATVRDTYARIMRRDTVEIPYFVLCDEGERVVRYPLKLQGQHLLLADHVLGTLSVIDTPEALVSAIRNAGFAPRSIAPKAVALYAQLRANGILYGKRPKYENQGMALVEALGNDIHPFAEIHFDLPKALGRGTWRRCCHYMREQGPARISSSAWGYESDARANAASAIHQYWQTRPVLLDLWLLGGMEFVTATIHSATIKRR